MAEHLTAHSGLDPVDVGWSLAGRSVFEHRAVVLGPDREQLLSGLGELAQNNPGAAVIHGNVRPGARPCSCSPVKAPNGSAWARDCTPHTRCSPKHSTALWPSWTAICCGRCVK
ncbi:phenolphthiocerol synthesis polyketide synthase type I Pks15/1 domain protein [Mycobacterium xenopi 3993]|nr:phenolphthiocerol synthesis polyketide synthase type I Pks15/1 domain protein [Mycobacterium xenopi 3993]